MARGNSVVAEGNILGWALEIRAGQCELTGAEPSMVFPDSGQISFRDEDFEVSNEARLRRTQTS